MTLLALGQAASALLALVETTATQEGIDLPERRYVSASAAGSEAWDCEQVVVTLIQLNPANAGSGQTGEWSGGSPTTPGAVSVPELYLQVQIVRPIPIIKDSRNGGRIFPPQEEEQAAGMAAMVDAALLHRVRATAMTRGLLPGSPGDIRIGPIVPAGGEGGYAGMALVVGVTVAKLVGP